MSGLFGALDSASRALFVVQKGVEVAGHNIANVNTPGYSRQTQVLASAPAVFTRSGAIGTGVEQITVQRMGELFMQSQLMQEDAAGGALRPQATALAAIEELISEQQGGGLAPALSDFYAALDGMASATAPGAVAEREEVVGAARSLTDALHRTDAQLRDRQRNADRSLVSVLDEVNSLTGRIAQLNIEIVRAETVAPANDLRDQRDLLLRELSRKVEVQTFEDDGAAVVVLGNGAALVEGSRARTLVVGADPANPFDPSFARVLYDDGISQRDVTNEIGGGELGGLLRVRDTLIPAAIRSVDVLAYNLASSVNAVHAPGVGLDGSTGNDFFTALAGVEDAARDLQLDPGIAANPDAIAAGLSSQPGDNRNALALAALREQAIPLALPGDPPGPPSGPTRSLLEHASLIVADVGRESRVMKDAVDQHGRVIQVLETRRDQVSGVSLDEEVTGLVRLQAAFQANARVVSLVNELLHDVVSML